MMGTSTCLRTINSPSQYQTTKHHPDLTRPFVVSFYCHSLSRQPFLSSRLASEDSPRTTANRIQDIAKMKLALILSTLSLLGVTHGYVVKAYDTADCSGDPETYDYASNGKRSPIEASRSVKYQSDIGCVLSTYNSEGGQKATTRNQNSCFSPGYVIEGTVCY